MVKKIFKSILVILILYTCFLTIYKVYNNHKNKLYNVLNNEISYASKKCYLEKKCEESFTLKELYDNKYLDILYDPITKEEINKNLKISIKDNKVIIEKIHTN